MLSSPDIRYLSYPHADDIADKLKSSKLWPFGADDQVRALDQARIGASSVAAEWERRSGYKPFLASYANANPQTRPFAEIERDGTVQFRGACVGIQSVAMGGRSYGANDYELLSGEELAYEPPYTGLRFYGALAWGGGFSPRQRVQISATWGYCDELPAFVWQQCQQAGALIALTSVENLQNIGSLSVDGISKSFDVVGVISQTLLLTTWGKEFLQAVGQYRRDVVFS